MSMACSSAASHQAGRAVPTKQVPCLIAVSLDTDAKPKFMRVKPVSGWDQLEMSRRVLEMEGMGGFNYLHRVGYRHVQTVSAHLSEDEHFSPVLHTQIANLKTEIQGPYHRRPSDRHIASYFHENCFRFNRRNMREGIMDRLLNACALSVPLRAANRPADHPCRWLCTGRISGCRKQDPDGNHETIWTTCLPRSNCFVRRVLCSSSQNGYAD